MGAAVRQFPRGAFVRLGSRSPKDSWAWNRDPGPILDDGGDPLRFVLDVSERMSDDLLLALENDYAPHLWVRQWLDFDPWQEFRCFVKNRRLVGVSQQLTRAYFPEVEKDASIIVWAISCFFDQFRAESHLDDVVFDAVVSVKKRGNESEAEVKLLEINPSGPMTDPCLFDWNSGFDKTFRFVNEHRGMTTRRI